MPLSNVKDADVIVVGDLIADETQHVTVAGTTPENANVLNVLEGPLDITPGGAGNVALNCAGLGLKTVLYGATGGDDVGRQLRQAIHRGGVTARYCTYGEAPTRARRRIVTSDGMLLRLNRNGCLPASLAADAPAEEAAAAMRDDPSPQVLVLSDYGGGFLSEPSLGELISDACRRHIVILVDPPRDGNWKRFGSGQTVFKPNIRQALKFMRRFYPYDDSKWKHGWNVDDTSAVVDPHLAVLFVRHLAQALEQEGVVFKGLWITLGPGGSVIYGVDHDSATHFPVVAPVEVRDVTGAGDTALAVMAGVLAIGEPFSNGIKLANVAAGVAVQRRGCWQANWDEIIAALHKLYPVVTRGDLEGDSLFRTAYRCAGLEKP